MGCMINGHEGLCSTCPDKNAEKTKGICHDYELEEHSEGFSRKYVESMASAEEEPS